MQNTAKNKDELLKMSELADVSGVRYSTIKFYSEQGLLPYQQEEAGLVKRYRKEEAVKRLQEIKKLTETKRLSIDEIREHFSK